MVQQTNWCDVDIDGGCKITSSEVKEFVELFYPGTKPGHVTISFLNSKGKGRRRGECQTIGSSHSIKIYWATIDGEIRSGLFGSSVICGGNRTTVSDARIGCFMTLAHELRHAYQHEIHWNAEGFFRKRGYSSRPCEVDARRYVDESYGAICAFLGVTPDPHILIDRSGPSDDQEKLLEDLIGVLMECEAISADDIRYELSVLGMNNPINLNTVLQELLSEGVVVS